MAKLIQGQKYTLSGSGVTLSQTTIPLSSFNLPDGSAIVSGDLATINYGTLEPGTAREEIISFTGLTSTTLTGVTRGLQFTTPYTADSSLRQAHAGGSVFVISNNPQVYQNLISTTDGTMDSSYSPSSNYDLTTKTYVDTREGYWTGVVASSTALPMGTIEGEARVTLDDGKIYVWDILTATKATYSSVASNVITTSAAHGLSVGEYVYWETTDTLPTGLAISTPYYVLTTPSTTTLTLSATKAGSELTVTTGSAAGTNTMREATWTLAGAGGGAGTVYVDNFLGTDATDAPTNTTFTLTTGSFTSDVYLQVYVNGVLQENGASEDYTTSGTTIVILNTAVADTDKVTLLVVSVDLYNPAWNNVTGDILPDVTNTHDIGSDTKRFKDAYLEGNVDIDGTLNVEGAATFQAKSVFSAGASGINTVSTSFVAGENVTAGDALSIAPYFSDGGLQVDTTAYGEGTTGTGGATHTVSITVADNTNRALVVFFGCDSGASAGTSAYTFNGVAMTKLTSETYNTTGLLESFILFAPAVGTYNFSIAIAGTGAVENYAIIAYSLHNVTQSVDVSSDMSVGTTALTLDTTPTVEHAQLLSVFHNSTSGVGATSSIVNAANNQVSRTANQGLLTGLSGYIYPKQQTTVSGTLSNANGAMASIALTPLTAPTYGVVKADGSAVANACNINLATNFIGFADTTVTAGNSVDVITNGVYSGLTSLSPYNTYYVSDTAGALSLSAGTISKVVGNQ